MKNNIFNLISLFILLFSSLLLAEAPDTLWTRTYGEIDMDIGYSAQQTNDGGFIILGYTESFGSGNGDVYLIRSNSNGDTLWTKTYDGDSADMGYSIQQTSDNGFIIARWKKTLHATVEEYLAQYQRELRATIENLREKYNQPLHEILKKRDEANAELAGYLKELGYES